MRTRGEGPILGKWVFTLAGDHEHVPAVQPVPASGSGKPPNKGITIDQQSKFPYCVLVIDQSPTVRSMVKACLEREGMLVFDFPDSTKALQWLEELACKPHVVLLDIDTPEADWLPLIQYLCAQPAYASTIVVALSCNHDTLYYLHEHPVNVRGFLIKPFLWQDLLHVVQRSLHVSKTR